MASARQGVHIGSSVLDKGADPSTPRTPRTPPSLPFTNFNPTATDPRPLISLSHSPLPYSLPTTHYPLPTALQPHAQEPLRSPLRRNTSEIIHESSDLVLRAAVLTCVNSTNLLPLLKCPPEILASSSLHRGSEQPCPAHQRVASHGVPESKNRRSEETGGAQRMVPVSFLRDISVPSHLVIGHLRFRIHPAPEAPRCVSSTVRHGHAIAPHLGKRRQLSLR